MTIGSKEHRRAYLEDLLKKHQETAWESEIILTELDFELVSLEKHLEATKGKLERKEFKSANDGKRELFIIEREIEHHKQKIAKEEGNRAKWLARMELINAMQKAGKSKE